jgi:hypothetical protein
MGLRKVGLLFQRPRLVCFSIGEDTQYFFLWKGSLCVFEPF